MPKYLKDQDRPLALVSDDEALTSLRLQKMLSGVGYRVISARDGQEAVEQAREHRPDVIFMDVQMPRLDGITALQQIVQARPVPVIVLTAFSDQPTVQRALAAGAAGYLVKPFQDEQVLAALAVARAQFALRNDLQQERDTAETHAAASARKAEQSQHLFEETRAQLEAEREVARALAESFLCPVPDVPGLDIGTWYEPAWRADLVGGDYYDFIPLPENRLGIMLGDVCGKGLAAARVTSQARYILRAYALEDPSPARAVTRLNRALCQQLGAAETFITLVYGVLDLSTFRFTYASAGHVPPILCRADRGKPEILMPTGGVLGIEPGWNWEEREVEIEPGEAIATFTDGLTEARRGTDQLGLSAVGARLCGRLPDDTALSLAGSLADQARSFSGDRLSDDLAIVIIRRPPGPKPHRSIAPAGQGAMAAGEPPSTVSAPPAESSRSSPPGRRSQPLLPAKMRRGRLLSAIPSNVPLSDPERSGAARPTRLRTRNHSAPSNLRGERASHRSRPSGRWARRSA